MAERNLDFDTLVERRNTNCLKYDFAKRRGMPDNLISMWVADMDFKGSSYIQDAVHNCAEHGIYGYSEVQEPYFRILEGWMKRHYDWQVDIKWLLKTPGVVFALAMAVQAFTEKGDGVLIQKPVYYPFFEVIEDNDRRVVDNTLIQDENGKYQIDFEDFERKIQEENIKLFFLCNPQNPTGRVWTREELERMGDICVRHGVIVASDEIHADFVWEGKHLVFANLKEEYKKITITCTSPSKTFNMAGLQISNIFIANPKLKRAFRKKIAAAGYSQLNTIGLAACAAAYRDGEEWYTAAYDYIKHNIQYTLDFVAERIPGVKAVRPEGTYLLWLDFRELGLTEQKIYELVVERAGLWLDGGTMFGKMGEGFQRINAACPRVTLNQALKRLEQAVKNFR